MEYGGVRGGAYGGGDMGDRLNNAPFVFDTANTTIEWETTGEVIQRKASIE